MNYVNSIILNEETLNCQRTFRLLVNAMCNPGKIYDISFIDSIDRNGYIYLIAKTLIDNEVSFCIIGDDKDKTAKKIFELTGSVYKDITEADFVIITDSNSRGEIVKAKIGTPEYPDSGATLIYYLSPNNIQTVKLKLKGPGIKEEKIVSVEGIKKEEFILLKTINANYPLGLDSIFIYESGKILSLPRSTRILEVY